MKVFIVFDFEGEYPDGVFSSEALAQAYIDSLDVEDQDRYGIWEFEVDRLCDFSLK